MTAVVEWLQLDQERHPQVRGRTDGVRVTWTMAHRWRCDAHLTDPPDGPPCHHVTGVEQALPVKYRRRMKAMSALFDRAGGRRWSE